MAMGAGKYDKLATRVRLESKAKAVMVIILEGKDGSGFSVQAVKGEMIINVPSILRELAIQIENDMVKGKI